MKPNLVLVSLIALLVSGSVALQLAAQGPPGPSTGAVAPKFTVDPAWPKIPNNWQFGQVASVSVDADDHVWILQRPSTLEPHEKGRAAPPVLEFDATGNFLRGWGGPGTGYEWPTSEHGIYIDHRQFVWIGGNGPKDHQILKFTKDGTFVMQIGKAGQSKGNADTLNLSQPADTFVHAKTNELLVADGYGNRRIIVFDADTGAFKRMWGAFGNRPTDDPPNPAPADADERGAAQFVQPVHAARVSTDGLVYVSDRGGKRVQVFTIEGKYLSQVFIGRECRAPECGNGTTAVANAVAVTESDVTVTTPGWHRRLLLRAPGERHGCRRPHVAAVGADAHADAAHLRAIALRAGGDAFVPLELRRAQMKGTMSHGWIDGRRQGLRPRLRLRP